MTQKNEFLAKDIEERIGKARNDVPEKDDEKKSLMYILLTIAISLASLLGLLRYLM